MIEKLCLVLYFIATKLRHYMLSYVTYIITQTDVVKYTLSRPILHGRMGKWSLALVEFHLVYVSQKAIKGQALADFFTDHPCDEVTDINETMFVALAPWKLNFGGSRTTYRADFGVILESLMGIKTQMAFKFRRKLF